MEPENDLNKLHSYNIHNVSTFWGSGLGLIMGTRKLSPHMKALKQAVESRDLPWPLPTKYCHLTDKVVCAYIENAADIFDEVGDKYPLAAGIYADSLREHVRVRHGKLWDHALAAYRAMPLETSLPHVAKWLVRLSGNDSAKIDQIIELIKDGGLEYFMFCRNELVGKLNQKQWDCLAPLVTDFSNQNLLRLAVEHNAKKLTDHDVTVWYPPVEIDESEEKKTEIEQKVSQLLTEKRPSDEVSYFLYNSLLNLHQSQWDQLLPLVTYQGHKKDLLKLIATWETELKEKDFNPKFT